MTPKKSALDMYVNNEQMHKNDLPTVTLFSTSLKMVENLNCSTTKVPVEINPMVKPTSDFQEKIAAYDRAMSIL